MSWTTLTRTSRSEKKRRRFTLEGLSVFCGLALVFVFLQNHFYSKKKSLLISQNCSLPLQNLNKLVFVQSKHPKSSGRSGMLQHMCVGYLCVHVLSCSLFLWCLFAVSFCWVQRGFPRSADLPKGVKDRVRGEKKRGERGTERGSERRTEIK